MKTTLNSLQGSFLVIMRYKKEQKFLQNYFCCIFTENREERRNKSIEITRSSIISSDRSER